MSATRAQLEFVIERLQKQNDALLSPIERGANDARRTLLGVVHRWIVEQSPDYVDDELLLQICGALEDHASWGPGRPCQSVESQHERLSEAETSARREACSLGGEAAERNPRLFRAGRMSNPGRADFLPALRVENRIHGDEVRMKLNKFLLLAPLVAASCTIGDPGSSDPMIAIVSIIASGVVTGFVAWLFLR